MTFNEAIYKVDNYLKNNHPSVIECDRSDDEVVWGDDYSDYSLIKREFDFILTKLNVELIRDLCWTIPVDEHFDELIKILEK